MNNSLLGFQNKNTAIHRINALAKLLYFLMTSVVLMLTYDIRLIAVITIVSLISLKIAQVEWSSVSFVVKIVVFFSVVNLLAVYIFSPSYGVQLYGTRTVLVDGLGAYSITSEQLFYEFNLLLKYFATVPLVIVFLVSMNPSEFASSFNRIGVPYRVAYAISLTLRYIPDIQRDYINIRNAQSARGLAPSGKEPMIEKIKKTIKLTMPLILTSFSRIETISHAMMLRRFGQIPKRSWYVEKKLQPSDYLTIGLGLIWFVAFLVLLKLNQGRFYNPFR